MAEKNSYGTIFKTTFLFGFVQLFKAFVSIIKNKIAAVLIGAEGMGMIGIFNATIQMLQTGAGLGVNQSAVRDVSEANALNDNNRFSRIISVTNKVIMFTGLIGCLITLILSKWLSYWTFGDNAHIIAYCFLSITVALNIINDSKQAILKGMRQLRSLAKASIIGSSISLLISAPLFYFFGKDGIVPELIIASILAVLVSEHYVRRIQYNKIKLSVREVYMESKPMVKMGMALMLATFLQTIVAFVINAFIQSKGSLADVGYYSAGFAITNSYFGLVITALMTDYYPRIAAVNKDNYALQDELNKQSVVSLVLCCPMFVAFMTLLPLFIQLLYSMDFMPTVDFVKWSIYFTLITACSNQVDMILVAKGETKVFLTISVIFRVLQTVLCIGLYGLLGLKGLGIAYMTLGIVHMTIMCITVYYLYKIRFTRFFVMMLAIVLLFAVSSTIIQSLLTGVRYYYVSALVFIASCFFSYMISVKHLKLDVASFIKNRISNK